MRWVTYYELIMMGGKFTDIIIHKDKESATKYFKTHYKDHFPSNFKSIGVVKLPMSYGYRYRSFNGVSILTFKRTLMKRFGISEKEFYKQLNKLEHEAV